MKKTRWRWRAGNGSVMNSTMTTSSGPCWPYSRSPPGKDGLSEWGATVGSVVCELGLDHLGALRSWFKMNKSNPLLLYQGKYVIMGGWDKRGRGKSFRQREVGKTKPGKYLKLSIVLANYWGIEWSHLTPVEPMSFQQLSTVRRLPGA